MKIKFINQSNVNVSAVGEVCGELGIELAESADICVTASRGEALCVCGERDNIKITYSRQNELFRALSYIPEFVKSGREIREKNKYSMLCYMADNSRNAVFNIPSAKKMIRYLALMGYDSMMLYTEDTYELEGYPYFGHMRGRFSEAELRELDDYAYMLGIELIPCVQTLAHLSTALRWPDFDGYKDNHDILLVGDERTYKFVEAVLKQCKRCFRSDRINLGMDEAHFIGCGQYLKKNGYRNPADIMLEHLNKVVNMCTEIGYRPMIWSDMFFRMQFDGVYRVREGEILQSVINKVPAGVELVYWDYYSIDEQLFCHMLDCHAQFGNKILFAGGAWKWYGYGTHNAFSLLSTKMQLDKCEERGIDSIIVTSWGDYGGMASQFSIMSTLLYFAERNYGSCTDDGALNERSLACFGASLEELMAFDLPDSLPEIKPGRVERPQNPSNYLLFNDPLERLMDCHVVRETAATAFAENAEKLMNLAKKSAFGYALEPLGHLCRVLSKKCDMGWRIYEAYQANDLKTLKDIAQNELEYVISELDSFIASYRKQWYTENKTFGFITQEIRLGGLKERLYSVKERLLDYTDGKTDKIEEVEASALPMFPDRDGEYVNFNNWNAVVAAGIL